MNRLPELIDALKGQLNSDQLITEFEARGVYSSDAYTTERQVPSVVVLPETTQDVVSVVKACRHFGIALVTRGAGTGLSGGATPIDGAVLMATSRMRNVGELQGNRMWVQPGVRNLQISEHVQHLGLYFAPDPSSQSASTIGGNVAENSGGLHCCKYGVTVNNVLALEWVTPEGEVIQLGQGALDNSGFDLMAMLHGSEGLMGVVTQVCVELLPIPPAQQVIAAGFSDLFEASAAVAAVFEDGLLPAAIEVVDGSVLRAVEGLLNAGFPTQCDGMVLLEMDGTIEDVNETIEQAKRLLAPRSMTLEVSRNEAHRISLWKARKAAFPAMAMNSPDILVLDATVPRSALAPALRRVNQLSDAAGLRIWNAYHAGDGNIHPSVLFDASKGETEQAHALGAEVLKVCLEFGGTITGEHGIGIEKIDYMCLQFTSAENRQFQRLKEAVDPDGLMNPGKAIPTPHRCAEGGAMHVHDGQFAHPELERY